MYRLIRLMIALLIVIPPGFLIVWLGVLEMRRWQPGNENEWTFWIHIFYTTFYISWYIPRVDKFVQFFLKWFYR